MNFSVSLETYISEKLGFDNVEPFKTWAFTGMSKHLKNQGSLIERWNLIHETQKIKTSMNLWDAIDRMIEIWKERFG